jgi:hypothetical protein
MKAREESICDSEDKRRLEGDAVEDVVSCEIALGLPCKDVCDLLITARVVVDRPGPQANRPGFDRWSAGALPARGNSRDPS